MVKDVFMMMNVIVNIIWSQIIIIMIVKKAKNVSVLIISLMM